MKSLLIILSTIFFFQFATAKTVETTLTCQQDDGDQWIEVAIALNDGPGLRAYVVAHDEDTQTDKLITTLQVTKNTEHSKTIFEDKYKTFRLVVFKHEDSLIGNFVLLQESSGGIRKYNLSCYENSTISFQK